MKKHKSQNKKQKQVKKLMYTKKECLKMQDKPDGDVIRMARTMIYGGHDY